MHIGIITEPFTINMTGFSGTALNKDYTGTAFRLMDRMWQTVKSNNIKNKGMNIWVYEQGDRVFAGVEPEEAPGAGTGLEYKSITLPRHARYKHVGPYQLIKQAGEQMNEALKNMGYETVWPYIEIYGHWTNDETKLETDLLMSLK